MRRIAWASKTRATLLIRSSPCPSADETGRCGAVPASQNQRLETFARFQLLPLIALAQHFLENIARAALVAHVLVSLGEIELLLHVVPVIVAVGGANVSRTRVDVEVVQVELEIHI